VNVLLALYLVAYQGTIYPSAKTLGDYPTWDECMKVLQPVAEGYLVHEGWPYADIRSIEPHTIGDITIGVSVACVHPF
jgi:hypothetical protein